MQVGTANQVRLSVYEPDRSDAPPGRECRSALLRLCDVASVKCAGEAPRGGGLVLAVGEDPVKVDDVEVGVEAHVGGCPPYDRDGAPLPAGRGRAQAAPVEAEHEYNTEYKKMRETAPRLLGS
jgi:hypothetical protein